MNNDAAMFCEFGKITMCPDTRKPFEICCTVASTVCIIPEADRRRREWLRAHQFPGFSNDRVTVLVENFRCHAKTTTLQLAAPDGKYRIAECEAAQDVCTTRNRRQLQVIANRVVHVVETLRCQRRTGRKYDAKIRECKFIFWPEARFLERRNILGTCAENRYAFLFRNVPQNTAVAEEWRAVEKYERRAGSQAANQPVPHHPATRREVKQLICACNTGMQHMFFDLLQQRSTMTMNDALRNARRAGRIHDVQRVVEVNRRDFKFCIGHQVFIPVADVCHRGGRRSGSNKWHDYCPLN